VALIRPFAGVRFARDKFNGGDVSKVIAPPYDVLDDAGKFALQGRHPNNIVNVDLPHIPPKTPGPDAAYAQANTALQAWLRAGILVRDRRPALYPYTQTYDHNGRTLHRRGFIALVRLSPFGQGQVVPHEQTYAGAIEDRMKLMRAMRMQLSPIFGLFSDSRHEVTNALYENLGRPELTATMDGGPGDLSAGPVKNDLWSVIDADLENRVIDLMGTKPVYIADGHHRYTTALQYQAEQEKLHGGKLPPSHPANYCMFVLVGMQEDGLIILPTHRLVGGLQNFTIDAFKAAVGANLDVTETVLTPDHVDEFVNVVLPRQPAHTFGLYDGRAKKLYQLTLNNVEVLAALEPNRSDAWRRLDVAILQRYMLDEVIAPKFAAGKEVLKGYTPDPFAVVPQADGDRYQIALLLRPTPIGALEQLGQHGEVMPQKSTYFYPKLATGMVMQPLE
jgi:uncharacterized protein (DUF1015 family)